MPSDKEKTLRNISLLLVVGTLGLLAACGGGTPSGVPVPPPPGQNIQPIVVDGGITTLPAYINAAFVTVNICVPGTTTCQSVDHILVDTGSSGLRVLASQLTIALVPLNDGSGNTLGNCVQFGDGSYLWGTVAPADVKMAGEVASATSVQVIADPPANTYPIPSLCSTGGTGADEDNQASLLANGILGVGPEPFDCGTACDPNTGSLPQVPPYYLCPSTVGTCTPVPVSCGTLCGDSIPNQQVTNPVFNFTGDNNGVILDLPAVAGPTVTGSMIFGIGTQSNNALGSAIVYAAPSGQFTTTYPANGQSLIGFIDSGSNGIFFPDATIPICTDNTSWYCPTSTLSLSATNAGANGTVNTVSFSVANFDAVIANPADFAFNNVAGPLDGAFDWGLPFFYGRKVFTAIDGTTTPGGAGSVLRVLIGWVY